MTYMRVIPRDLFNEASLLKCLGKLWIELENWPDHVRFGHDGGAFDIVQDQNDGSLYVANVSLWVRGNVQHLSRPLNSRGTWPLYCTTPDDDVLAVFDDEGKLSREFKDYLRGL